jgi:hypothetical protein
LFHLFYSPLGTLSFLGMMNFTAYNGPEIGKGNEVLRDALDLHFSKSRLGWHFTTNTLFHSEGPTVDKILNTK